MNTTRNRVRTFLYIIAGTIFGIITTESFTGAYTLAAQYYFSNLNSETTGEIVVSGDRYQDTRGGVKRVYEVEYLYYVKNKSKMYRNDTVKYDTRDKDINRVLTDYPVGKEVTVYYDSGSPGWAILEKNSKLSFKVYWLLALNFTLGPIAGYFFSR